MRLTLMTKHAFGKRLRKYRLKQKLSLRELETRSGVDHVQLWRLEQGASKLDALNVKPLAASLGISPDVLLGE